MATVNIAAAGTGDIIQLGPIRMRVLEDGSRTDNRIGAVEIIVPPGVAGPPRHLHRMHDETFLIISGVLQFTVGDTMRDAHAGDYVVVPVGAPHTFANVSPVLSSSSTASPQPTTCSTSATWLISPQPMDCPPTSSRGSWPIMQRLRRDAAPDAGRPQQRGGSSPARQPNNEEAPLIPRLHDPPSMARRRMTSIIATAAFRTSNVAG